MWNYDDNHPSSTYGQIVGKRLGEEAGKAVDRIIDVYRVLANTKFTSPGELRNSFFDGDNPLFSETQSQNIYKQLQQKTGGGSRDGSVLNNISQQLIDMISGTYVAGPVDPRLTNLIAAVQTFVRGALPFVFVLHTLEQAPMFGELVGTALDITAATLPVAATAIQSQTPALVGLIPLPFAGPVGIGLGWLFSFFFLWVAMVIGLSRKDFSAAIEATAGMIPVIGGTAMRAVASADKVATKLSARAQKIYDSIQEVYGNVSGALSGFQIANSPLADTMRAATKGTGLQIANSPLADTMRAATKGTGLQIANSPFAATKGGRKRFTKHRRSIRKWRKTRRQLKKR